MKGTPSTSMLDEVLCIPQLAHITRAGVIGSNYESTALAPSCLLVFVSLSAPVQLQRPGAVIETSRIFGDCVVTLLDPANDVYGCPGQR